MEYDTLYTYIKIVYEGNINIIIKYNGNIIIYKSTQHAILLNSLIQQI